MPDISNTRLSCLSTTAILPIAISFSISLVLASSIPVQPSSVKTLFVSNEPVVLDLNGEDGNWLIETEPDRILFISFSGDGVSDFLKHSLEIYDGLGPDDLLFPSETDESLNDEEILQHHFYSTGDTIDIRFRHLEVSVKTHNKYQLKIQKAVDCPINLGGQSSCGRVVDNTSCYCTTFQPRNWADTKTYCLANNMTFFRVDGYEEDLAVYRQWGNIGIQLWIGASDVSQEGYFTWDNGGRPMSPGYTNWGPNAPDNAAGNEDCVHYGLYDFAWDDWNCATLYGGVCEAQP